MTTTDFLTSIRAGDLDACGPLSDWLEDHDDLPRARRLRQRYRRWKRERGKAEELVNTTERALTARWDDLAATVRSLGGSATVQVSASRQFIEDQDNLLIAYVERLLAEIAEVTPDRVPLWVRGSQPGGATDHVVLALERSGDVEWIALLCTSLRRLRAASHCELIPAPVATHTGMGERLRLRRCRSCLKLLPTVKLADLPRATG